MFRLEGEGDGKDSRCTITAMITGLNGHRIIFNYSLYPACNVVEPARGSSL